MGDEITVDVFDLKDNSVIYVDAECDYCNETYEILWSHRTKMYRDNPKHRDCCKSCTWKKAAETNKIKYGKSNPNQVEEFRNKTKRTNMEQYGVENTFQFEKFKEKIKQTNLERYGCTSFTQTQEYRVKKEKTLIEKYGVPNIMELDKYRYMFRGEKSPVWKGGIRTKRTERITWDYKNWRAQVFERDDHTCQKCNQKGNKIEAHHILSWKNNKELRYDVENGITLCVSCHKDFHKNYGLTIATRENLIEFIQTG